MKITMAHGSGGKDSAWLMETVFAKQFHNEILDRMEDAAVLDLSGPLAVSTDSFVVTPLVFAGGDIGKLSICGTVNDLLMMGARPAYLTCGFILEEGLEVDLLEQLAISMAETARQAGVRIVAGDTKVVEGRGGLYINTTGIGRIPDGRDVGVSRAKPGDALLVSGTLGDHHACILSARMEIENGIESDCACLSDLTAALFDAGIRVHTLRDITRGGLGTVLNEIAAGCGCGIELWERQLPVSPQVQAFCGLMGLDPLYMGNEGKLLAIVEGQDAGRALEVLRQTPNGRNAARVGVVTEGGRVLMKTGIGGTRRVEVLFGEGLPRIC